MIKCKIKEYDKGEIIMNEKIGCLGSILKIFGLLPKEVKNVERSITDKEERFPYALRDDFLSASELSFYKTLNLSIEELPVVLMAKVSLADLFFIKVSDFKERQVYWNKINRKHVDFVICDEQTLKPLIGIELDDSSHQQQKRMERDQFVNQVFKAAKLPLVHIKAQSSYSVSELLELVSSILTVKEKMGLSEEKKVNQLPICPKCGIPMIERETKKGNKAGQKFYGCSNFPQCREIKQY